MRSEIEDGMGFAGLVPTVAERREGSDVKRLGDRIVALTSERDDYILKQKVWEAANEELRSEHIRLRRALELFGEPSCEHLHHAKRDQHEGGQCPVVARIRELTRSTSGGGTERGG